MLMRNQSVTNKKVANLLVILIVNASNYNFLDILKPRKFGVFHFNYYKKHGIKFEIAVTLVYNITIHRDTGG